jgi:hypothetical protein
MFTGSITRSTRINVGDIAKKLKGGPTQVKVGLVAGKTDGEEIKKGIWNHYGTRGGRSGGGWGGPIPARPFLANAMRANRKKYQNMMSSGAHSIFTQSASPLTILQRLGVLAQGHTQEEITNLQSPPNSPLTIKLKGFANPLVNIGGMRKAITYSVEN